MRGIIPAFLLSLSVGTAHGQFFTNYGAEQGLMNPDLSHALKDNRGFLWVSSSEGLWRFDGATFTRFDTQRPLSSGAPRDLAEKMALAPDGRIWMVSFATGLRMFDPATERCTSWPELTGDTASTDFTLSPVIVVLSNDSILALDLNQGLILFLPEQGLVRQLAMPPGADRFEGRFLMRDHTLLSRIWVGANGGLWTYDLVTGDLLRQELPDGLVDRDGVIHVEDMIGRPDGGYWIGTWGDGLIDYDPRNSVATCYAFDSLPPYNGAKNIIFGLARRSPDELYVAAHNGLWLFHEKTHRFRFIGHDPEDIHSLLPGNLLGVLVEENGTLWCCTQNGLSCLAPEQNLFARVKLGKQLHRTGQVTAIQGIVELGEQWLVATDISGLLLVDKVTGSIRRVFGPKRSAPRDTYTYYIDMFRCGGDSIELRTDEGAFLLDPKTWKMRRVLKESFAAQGNVNVDGWGLCCEGKGWAWTGTRHGCYRTNSAYGELIAYDMNAPPGQRIDEPGLVAGIARDQRGRTWFSLEGTGIVMIPPAGSPIHVYRAQEHPWMLTPEIWDLDIDAKDRLWIGTREYGMVITPADDPGGAGTRYLNNKDGMTGLVSTVKVQDGGDVWAGGSSGLFRISTSDFSIHRFGTEDGLYSANFFSADIREHPSGLMTIESARNEFIWFHPDSLEVPLVAPRVWLEGAAVNGLPLRRDSTLNASPHLSLPYDSNYVEIRFTAIALTQRHRIALEYRLVGSSERWERTRASGTAIFTGLPPGTYTFEVRAADLPDAPVTRLAITIVPAFWQTTWFKALCIALVLAGTTFAVRWRLRTVRGQERLRSDFERRIGEVEMSALRAQMNPHFLFNSLNSINRYIVKHEPRIASEYLTKFSRLMRSVLNNSKEKLVPLKDDLDALLLYIDLESLRFTNRFELVSNIELEEDPGSIMVPPLLLQPYVENAIWHGLMHKKEGAPVLKVSIHQHKDVLRCEVEDNGLGRAHAAMLRSRSTIQRESMGTRITQDRLDLLKRLYNMDVSVVYTDLMDAAQRPLGTRVTLTLQRQPRV